MLLLLMMLLLLKLMLLADEDADEGVIVGIVDDFCVAGVVSVTDEIGSKGIC